MRFFYMAFFISMSISTTVYCQDSLVFGDTANTNITPTNKKEDKGQKHRRIVQWVKNDSKGLLIGNPCMEDVMAEMGFTYLIQMEGMSVYKNTIGRYFHNKGVKIKLFFRNGPFWRVKLKKKRRECRLQTRDFVG